MNNYHINPAGNVGKCSAKADNCPFGAQDEHYASPEEARLAYERKMELLDSFEEAQEHWYNLQAEAMVEAERIFKSTDIEILESDGYEGQKYLIVQNPNTGERFRISAIDELSDGEVSHFSFESLDDEDGIDEVSVSDGKETAIREIVTSIHMND